jgi:hypothetical protein
VTGDIIIIIIIIMDFFTLYTEFKGKVLFAPDKMHGFHSIKFKETDSYLTKVSHISIVQPCT